MTSFSVRVYIACLHKGLGSEFKKETDRLYIQNRQKGFQSEQGELKVCLGLSSLVMGSAAFFPGICYIYLQPGGQVCYPVYIITCFIPRE